MTKVIRIVENNHVTGVVYGTVEISDLNIIQRHKYKQQVAKQLTYVQEYYVAIT